MAPVLRINVNESEMTETWKDTVCSLCRIGGACASSRRWFSPTLELSSRLLTLTPLGDYTLEFQSVLRACEEHLDDFRFSFLPYGLLIKFANEGGDNNDDKPDEETKDEANDDDKPDEETKEEAKDLTPHLSSMTFIDVFVSDVGGENRQKYVVDLKDGDGMDFYLKVVKDFDYPDSAVLYKKDNGLEISACWMLRVFAGLLNDGDELVINCKYSSAMGWFAFHIDTYDGTFGYTLWASKQDTIRDIYERALKLPNVVLSKLSHVFTAEADTNQDAKKCSGEFDCQEGGDVVETSEEESASLVPNWMEWQSPCLMICESAFWSWRWWASATTSSSTSPMARLPKQRNCLISLMDWVGASKGATASNGTLKKVRPILLLMTACSGIWTKSNWCILSSRFAGGAKGVKVIKTVLKGNVRDLSCVDTSDKSTSESVIIQSQKLTTFKVEDVKAVFTSLPLETLQEMEAYLTKHKATANVKAQGVISFIPAIKDMGAIMGKIGATTERAKDIILEFFKSECADQEGEVCVPLLIKFIPGRIVVKKDGYTHPPVAVPSVAVPYADVHRRGWKRAVRNPHKVIFTM